MSDKLRKFNVYVKESTWFVMEFEGTTPLEAIQKATIDYEEGVSPGWVFAEESDWEIMEAVDVETETVYGPDGELHPEN